MEEFVQNTLINYAYLGMFLMLLACGFGVPLPEDIILFTTGYFCYKGVMTLPSSIMIAMAGVLIGDTVIFFAGRKFGAGMRKGKAPWPFKNLLTPERLRKIWGWFGKHGNKIIFIARFTAGMRAPTFAVAGTSGITYSRFLLWDGMAALISVPLFIWLAYYFGEELDSVKNILMESKWIIILIVLAIASYYGLKYYRKRKQKL